MKRDDDFRLVSMEGDAILNITGGTVATGLVDGNPSFSTPYRIYVP